MRRIIWIMLVFFFAQINSVYADRGSIPFFLDAKIFEPNQRAVIGWNGKEEVLLLSTELFSNKATKILEVIPLPAEPVVTRGDIKVFTSLTTIINNQIAQEVLTENRGKGNNVSGISLPTVTFHERIGAHDISVIRAANAENFVSWVENYLKVKGSEQLVIPNSLKEAVVDYINDGYRWFVFDIVDVDTKVKTNDVIQYRFASKSLYYPLRITKTETGSTAVDLIVVTEQLLSNFPGIPVKDITLQHRPVKLKAAQLAKLNNELYRLFSPDRQIRIRMWHIEGDLANFQQDLIAN